jgi:cytidylate kinase
LARPTIALVVDHNARVGSLTVVTGPPGAGKSTVAAVIAKRFDPSVLVAGDAFFDFLAEGAIEPWLPESQQQNDVVIAAAAAATGAFVAGGYTTIFDGVLGPWFLGSFLRRARLGALNYAVLLPSAEACVRRVATRRGHGFADEPATRKMHGEFSNAPVAARHVFVTDHQRVEETVDQILQRLDCQQLRYERMQEP